LVLLFGEEITSGASVAPVVLPYVHVPDLSGGIVVPLRCGGHDDIRW
jgi:hypothetical protein